MFVIYILDVHFKWVYVRKCIWGGGEKKQFKTRYSKFLAQFEHKGLCVYKKGGGLSQSFYFKILCPKQNKNDPVLKQ